MLAKVFDSGRQRVCFKNMCWWCFLVAVMPHSAGDLGESCLQCYICSKNPSSHLAKDGGQGIVKGVSHPRRQGEQVVGEEVVHGGGQEGGDVGVSGGEGGRGQEQEEHRQDGHSWDTGEGPASSSCYRLLPKRAMHCN